MLSFVEQIILVFGLVLSLTLSYKTFSRMVKVVQNGRGSLPVTQLTRRFLLALKVLILQNTVLKSRFLISIFHAFIAWAFVLYFLVNLNDLIKAFVAEFMLFGHNVVGHVYLLFVDIFSVLAIIGMTIFLLRRFVFNSPKLQVRENVKLMPQVNAGIRRDSLIVGLFILMHVGFRWLGESFVLASQGGDPWQPAASLMAMLWKGISSQNLNVLYHLSWWLAIGLILAFIPYFPYSKHTHLFMGPINFFFKKRLDGYSLQEPIDFEDEESEQFGQATLAHLEKGQLIDAYACIMCHRCQEVCPAYNTGKELSPSALEINKRYFLNQNAELMWNDQEQLPPFLDFALSESALWACTTCGACVEVCPVGNEPLYDLLGIRRDRVLMESQFPKQLQNAFVGMERNGNPWNMNEDRLAWIKSDESLKVPTVEENPDFEILYWVGCAGAFDQKGQRIAKAFTKILNAAQVNFAVLGNKESCTGDSARRAGNEYLFTMLAETNVQNLNEAGVKKIVTTCPHCLHTLKNEYPQFGGHYQVVHHSQFINQLIANNKLQLKSEQIEGLTFHDPCYLGRHNKEFEAPRQVLNAVTQVAIKEMANTRENSFCCGAGGAQMWKEEEPGQEAVRRARLQQAQKIKAKIISTACPFCLTMLTDASNETEAGIQVKDLAEIVAERI
ncbi:MAG: (Fe-S)-binding protein [Caldisericaceae bacterium]|nr:(Fe-S)-binding protein [Caldisericaceae bacterium]